MSKTIDYVEATVPDKDSVLALYVANGWSAADKPDELLNALHGSHYIVTAFHERRLVGLANSISDGHLVVYYPHLLVHPDMQSSGIGREIMARMKAKYSRLHQQSLFALPDAVAFYEKQGFTTANPTIPMWIYSGKDL